MAITLALLRLERPQGACLTVRRLVILEGIFVAMVSCVIALDIAKTQSQAARAIIAHEPPLARLHPHAEKWQRFFEGVHDTAFRYGNTLAMMKFAFGIGVDYSFYHAFKAARAARNARIETHERYLDQKIVTDFFSKQELLPVTNYLPDIEAIKRNKVKAYIAAGERSPQKEILR